MTVVRRPQLLAAFFFVISALIYVVYWFFFQGEQVEVTRPDARIHGACPAAVVPDPGFTDLPDDEVRRQAIGCIVWWGIIGGTDEDEFIPEAAVTRGQLATFLARTILATDAELEDDPPDAFSDDDGTPHEYAISAMAAEGLIDGVSDDRFGVGQPVTRAQAATFIARTYEFVVGESLPEGEDAFRDDDGGLHEDAINATAAAGIASGTSEDTFAPERDVTRADLATFVARLLDRFVDEGVAELPQ